MISINQTKLDYISITERNNNLTIKSSAFQNLNQLSYIEFDYTTIKTIQRKAFKLDNSINNKIIIKFNFCNLTGKN